MKKEEAYEQYKARLEKLAREKTEASRKAAEENAQRQLAAMGEYSDLSNGGHLAAEFSNLFMCLRPRASSSYLVYESTTAIRDALIQYLLFRNSLSYDYWHTLGTFDATISDESNLKHDKTHFYKFQRKERYARDNDIEDILLMLCKLARGLKSPSLPRIIELMADFDRYREVSSREEATKMVDDFIACFRRVMKETSLLDKKEADAIWPTKPEHEKLDDDHTGDDDYDIEDDECADEDDDSIDTTSKKKRKLTKSQKAYLAHLRKWGIKYVSLPGMPHPLDDLVRYTKEMADTAVNGELKPGAKWHKLDAGKLAHALGADTIAYIENSGEEGDRGFEVRCTIENDPQLTALQKQIVSNIDRYLTAALALAQSIHSRAYEDLVTCQSLEVKYEGRFFAYRENDKAVVAADRKTFIDTLNRSGPILWKDCAKHQASKNNESAPAKIDKGDSKIGKACSSFVTYFSKKKHLVKMIVKTASGRVDAPFKIISDEKLWSVISQLVSADAFPITLDNPWAPNKLNLKARFRQTKNREDARHTFYKYIHCVGKGSKAKYELRVG